jgi:chromosomal replication initiator protein
MQKKCSKTEFDNWIKPIKVVSTNDELLRLELPNIFVQEYLLDNYKADLALFFPIGEKIEFVISEQKKIVVTPSAPLPQKEKNPSNLKEQYTFDNFIEGPSNQFVKSAALGVATRPGKSFNPLFIHGGVGLGKTHLLHGIGNYIRENHKQMTTQYVTTETFINDLVNHLRNKSSDQMKRYFRSLDVLLIDDIRFLQNRLNFEEEFCNTFESLINQNKQVVITSDKPPSQLKLSERMIARMEWGLVSHIGSPELETRVAIIQHKAAQKNIKMPTNVAFFIADHIYNNVRQLEGALNRLSAYCKLMRLEITEEIAETLLKEMFEYKPVTKLSVEEILKAVALVFEVKVSDMKSESRIKNIALARQSAMYLAKELLNESLTKIAASFGGKTHSTLLHAWKKVSEQMKSDAHFAKQIQMAKRNLTP